MGCDWDEVLLWHQCGVRTSCDPAMSETALLSASRAMHVDNALWGFSAGYTDHVDSPAMCRNPKPETLNPDCSTSSFPGQKLKPSSPSRRQTDSTFAMPCRTTLNSSMRASQDTLQHGRVWQHGRVAFKVLIKCLRTSSDGDNCRVSGKTSGGSQHGQHCLRKQGTNRGAALLSKQPKEVSKLLR